MHLLVSVRAASEVAAALAGGADIIDAKDPAGGPLDSVPPDILATIQAATPPDVPLSVALGDVRLLDDVAAAFAGLRLSVRAAPVFVKLGFADVTDAREIRVLLRYAVTCARALPAAPRVIGVAYGDATAGRVWEKLPGIAAAAGAEGVLVDTAHKNGASLLAAASPEALASWILRARGTGLLTAVAGSLGVADIAVVRTLGPDIVGVRGAACEGGRQGTVQAALVAKIKEAS